MDAIVAVGDIEVLHTEAVSNEKLAGNGGVLPRMASQDAPLGRVILTARNVANSLRCDEPAA